MKKWKIGEKEILRYKSYEKGSKDEFKTMVLEKDDERWSKADPKKDDKDCGIDDVKISEDQLKQIKKDFMLYYFAGKANVAEEVKQKYGISDKDLEEASEKLSKEKIDGGYKLKDGKTPSFKNIVPIGAELITVIAMKIEEGEIEGNWSSKVNPEQKVGGKRKFPSEGGGKEKIEGTESSLWGGANPNLTNNILSR